MLQDIDVLNFDLDLTVLIGVVDRVLDQVDDDLLESLLVSQEALSDICKAFDGHLDVLE